MAVASIQMFAPSHNSRFLSSLLHVRLPRSPAGLLPLSPPFASIDEFDLLRFHRRFARVDIYRRVDLLKKEERRPRFEPPTLGAVGGDEDR